MSVSYIPELFAINDTLARQWQALRAAGRNELAAEVMAAGAAISKLMGKIVKAERNVFSSGGSSTGEQPSLKASAVAGSTPAPCSAVQS